MHVYVSKKEILKCHRKLVKIVNEKTLLFFQQVNKMKTAVLNK